MEERKTEKRCNSNYEMVPTLDIVCSVMKFSVFFPGSLAELFKRLKI